MQIMLAYIYVYAESCIYIYICKHDFAYIYMYMQDFAYAYICNHDFAIVNFENSYVHIYAYAKNFHIYVYANHACIYMYMQIMLAYI